MAKESTSNIQDLADRFALVQTILVAVLAKYVEEARQKFIVLPEGLSLCANVT